MITSCEITYTVTNYLAGHLAEREGLWPLLAELDKGASLTSRATLPGHVTCGAVVLDDTGRVLMVRHNALGRWLLPGGHLEPADMSLPAAALRELAEETGVTALRDPLADDATPVDIDLHEIPANRAKNEPAHWHADFRYVVQIGDTAASVRLQAEEVNGYAWRPPADLPAERLAAKVGRQVAAGPIYG